MVLYMKMVVFVSRKKKELGREWDTGNGVGNEARSYMLFSQNYYLITAWLSKANKGLGIKN